ncbi:glycosyltransferase [Candidatus Woesearchaeota archaeon]|nr:glycosyltransferase [Candidatus Woesearchaeota archaeon]
MSKDKRILLVCPSSPRTHAGGTVNMVMQIAKNLDKNFADISIMTTGKRPMKERFKNISLEEYPTIGSAINYFLSPSLIKSVHRKKADIIHCFGFNNLITLFLMMCKPRSSRLIVTPASAGSSSVFRKILLKLHTWIFKFFAGRIDAMIFLSKFEKELFLNKLGIRPRSESIIPIGVDIENINKTKINKKYEIVSVGRLVRNKGFFRLLKLFKKITEIDAKIRLKIIGRGKEGEKLKKRAKKLGISNKVNFIDKIPLDQRKRFFREIKESTAFVFLSRYESQGAVISEAVAAGLPVFIFSNSAQSEFIEKGWAIKLDEKESVDSMAQKICNALKRKRIYKNNITPPSIKDSVKLHRNLYISILH